jgi:Rod binding domain-containing protein
MYPAAATVATDTPRPVLGPNAARTPEATRAALQRSAVAYEGVFLSQMLKPMFEGFEPAEPFGGGLSEDVWRSFEIEAYGKAIAQSGGIGLADHVFRELLRAQEGKGAER